MKVLVFGSGSEVGEHLLKQLSANNHEVVTLAETENQAQELKDYGASDVILAENGDFSKAYTDCQAVIFIAGGSPISGESKDMLVDQQAFKESIEETKKQGIERFMYLSAVRSDESKETKTTGEKQKPEEILQNEDLSYTIIRPSQTVNKPGKGKVKATTSLKGKGEEIPFEDTAAFIVEALTNQDTHKKIIEITSGNTPIDKALRNL